MAEQFEEKKDNISEEEIKDTASTNEDNNGTVNQDEQTEEAVETVENKDTAEASDTASDSSSDDEGKKKGFFGKEKKDKKDKKDQKIDELTDQYRRTLAEFDNYRKRTEKEKTAMFEVGAKRIIEKLLPVIEVLQPYRKSRRQSLLSMVWIRYISSLLSSLRMQELRKSRRWIKSSIRISTMR